MWVRHWSRQTDKIKGHITLYDLIGHSNRLTTLGAQIREADKEAP